MFGTDFVSDDMIDNSAEAAALRQRLLREASVEEIDDTRDGLG
jgi:hypothetical protein